MKRDLEAGERAPLLRQQSTKKPVPTAPEKLGSLQLMKQKHFGSPDFYKDLEVAFTGALFACLIASIIWVDRIGNFFNEHFKGYVAMSVLLFVYTLYPNFGVTVQLCFQGIMGTLLACFNVWGLNRFFPDGISPGMGYNDSAVIVGYLDTFAFLFVMLSVRCSSCTKVYALNYHVWFMACFLNPHDKTFFSRGIFSLSTKGAAFNSMAATLLACAAALLVLIVPYPKCLSMKSAKESAHILSQDMAALYSLATECYFFEGSAVMVQAKLRQSTVVKEKIDQLQTDIAAAWFEGFDFGTRGRGRKMLKMHAEVMQHCYERFHSIEVAFGSKGDNHVETVQPLKEPLTKLCASVGSLLNFATLVSEDGVVTKHESKEVERQVVKVKEDVATLLKTFDTVRRGRPVIDEENLGVNSYVMAMSAYARRVLEFAEDLLSIETIHYDGFATVMFNATKRTFDISAMQDPFHKMYVSRYFFSIGLCIVISAFIGFDKIGTSVVGPATLLISNRVSADIPQTLNMLLGVVMGTMASATLYEFACYLGGHGAFLPVFAFLFWAASLYIYYNGGKKLGFLGMYSAAFASKSFVQNCHDVAPGEMGVENYVSGVIVAVLITAVAEEWISLDRPSKLATKTYAEICDNLRGFMDALWQGKETDKFVESLPGQIAMAQTFSDGARNEPRFWRNAWKGDMFDQLLKLTSKLMRNIHAIQKAAGGTDGVPDNIFSAVSEYPEFELVRKDMHTALDLLSDLSEQLLEHESGVPKSLENMQVKTGLAVLEDMPGLIAKATSSQKFPDSATLEDTCEDDVLVQLSVVLLMCSSTVENIAAMIELLTTNA
jgi:uncharacterized membrane protein YccC